jgi:hypothetical protein
MSRSVFSVSLASLCLAVVASASVLAADPPRMVQIDAGEFDMGSMTAPATWDEGPVHRVKVTRPFDISESEVTAQEFRRFRSDFVSTKESAPAVAGVSWHDAVAYCQWLSKETGKPFRLPTEAEWELAARSGRAKDMLDGRVGEWCADWFGEYTADAQTDPIGPSWGFAKVVRGGGWLHDYKNPKPSKYEQTPTNRGGVAPAFGWRAGDPNNFGQHAIGFRVVQAPPLASKPAVADVPFVRQAVHAKNADVTKGPDANRPYFRKRFLLPAPMDDSEIEATKAVGLHPSFQRHNHSPTVTVCPNGDVLYITYSSTREEREPDLPLIASRLRFGQEQWDMPAPLVDFPEVNDHAPLLWTDPDGVVRLFWGCPNLLGAYPFQWTESRDNGVTWSEVRFPRLTAPAGPHNRQPINSVVLDAKGVMYVPSDAIGATSVLWATANKGETWYDTGGRTGGRHTTFALLKDNATILGIGGKNSNIEGFTPQFVSRDGGKTYEASKTSFPFLANQQRPTLLRLKSGRLFFASDNQPKNGQPLPGQKPGVFVALSDDDGKTWHTKRLPGVLLNKADKVMPTLGYAASAQGPNGMIHLITSMNTPQALHFELNEAWLMAPETQDESDETLMRSTAKAVASAAAVEEKYDNGQRRAKWTGGLADDGRYLLHGPAESFYENGQKQWSATFDLGRKTGAETFWSSAGRKREEWQHRPDGASTWTQFWPSGAKRAESSWKDFKADGEATLWDESGKVIGKRRFDRGRLVDQGARTRHDSGNVLPWLHAGS